MLSEGLVNAGHDVTVLVTNTARETVVEQRDGVQVIKAGRIKQVASTPLSVDLVQQARTLNADVVNLHMPYPVGDLAAHALHSRALVLTYHSDIVKQQRLLRVYQPLQWWTLRRANRIIATSEAYIRSSRVLRRYTSKCRVVPLAVDVDRFATAPSELVTMLRQRYARSSTDCIILAVGVLRYYKGLNTLIDALTELDATLVIVGAGPEEQALRDLAQAFGVARRVHFVGGVADAELPAYYHAADIFVLPSQLRSEAFGIVQLEAMAAGLPVISTELGTGTSVVNQHSVTGFVVEPAEPHALAQAIRVLQANPELRHHMGRQAQQRVQQEYTQAHMVKRTLAVYHEALGERSDSAE